MLDPTRLELGQVGDIRDLDSDLEERPEDEVDEIVSLASASRNLAELEIEIARLLVLEENARALRAAEVDAKWLQMSQLLQEVIDPGGTRRKLVVFTEHRDTLTYVTQRIRDLLQQSAAVVTIHGGMGREQRRAAQDAFVDPTSEALILVATDAAGEGINLQQAHLMVNYDLPWNPNRLEQRFGRIHRFGQRNVCYNWNLVAANTREGAVYATLLDKLDEARQALGGKVFDVLGELFADRPLRDLMLQAIRAGEDPAGRAELERVVANVADLERYRTLVKQHALAPEGRPPQDLRTLRVERDRAETNRLVPYFIASFFTEAFTLLGGTIHEREPGAFQITHIPAEIRRRGREAKAGFPVRERYDRVWFDRRLIASGSQQDCFIAPGHPLLDATIAVIIERHGDALQLGAVLVDPRPEAETARILFAVRDTISDERRLPDGSRHVVSSELHFIELDENAVGRGGSPAPHLDYRPLTLEEQANAAPVMAAPWVADVGRDAAEAYASEHLVPAHLSRVKRQREEIVLKTRQAVDERLGQEMLRLDDLAAKLRQQEQAGKQPKVNADRAARQFEDLKTRRLKRLAELDRELRLVAQMPHVLTAALVLPGSLVGDLGSIEDEREPTGDRRRIEAIAMREVLAWERAAGREVRDVSADNLGYDIESLDPSDGRLRLLEVKGRDHRGATVTLTRNELMVARNKGADFVLAVVLVDGDRVTAYHEIPDPLATGDADDWSFGMVSSTFALDKLLTGQAVSG